MGDHCSLNNLRVAIFPLDGLSMMQQNEIKSTSCDSHVEQSQGVDLAQPYKSTYVIGPHATMAERMGFTSFSTSEEIPASPETASVPGPFTARVQWVSPGKKASPKAIEANKVEHTLQLPFHTILS